MKPKQTFNDIVDGIEAGRHYGLSTQEMEREIRHHTDGMGTVERRQFWDKYFREKK